MTQISTEDILAIRLANQMLSGSQPATPQEVTARLGALQAQDFYGAKWSLGLRAAVATDGSVQDALAKKDIVRSWLMRGTLHFTCAENVRWLVRLLGAGIITRNARRYNELELDISTLERGQAAIIRALQGRQTLNRAQLKTVLEAQGISTAGQRLIYILQYASLTGQICQSLAGVNNPAFFLIEEWLPPTPTLQGDEALARLAAFYFSTRSPATQSDFSWWSGLPAADARAALALVENRFERVQHASQTHLLWNNDPPLVSVETTAHLLPGFDEYLISYTDRTAALDPVYNRHFKPANGMLPSTIIINGQVAGRWKRTIQRHSVAIDMDLFRVLSDEEQAAVSIAAARYGEFLKLPVILSQTVME